MATPGGHGSTGQRIDLPCGETKNARGLDLGLREFDCPCGSTHAVVMDSHPLSRFVPEFLADALQEAIETDDEFDQFNTIHLMGMVAEEFPDAVVSSKHADDGQVGFALVWIADFDSRRLHEVVVELVVELMEHAISHAEDDDALSEFEEYMGEFDVDAFVTAYRAERTFESEHDTAI